MSGRALQALALGDEQQWHVTCPSTGITIFFCHKLPLMQCTGTNKATAMPVLL
jgi:hypothetical protein